MRPVLVVDEKLPCAKGTDVLLLCLVRSWPATGFQLRAHHGPVEDAQCAEVRVAGDKVLLLSERNKKLTRIMGAQCADVRCAPASSSVVAAVSDARVAANEHAMAPSCLGARARCA